LNMSADTYVPEGITYEPVGNINQPVEIYEPAEIENKPVNEPVASQIATITKIP
jgi:hypothetical protein